MKKTYWVIRGLMEDYDDYTYLDDKGYQALDRSRAKVFHSSKEAWKFLRCILKTGIYDPVIKISVVKVNEKHSFGISYNDIYNLDDMIYGTLEGLVTELESHEAPGSECRDGVLTLVNYLESCALAIREGYSL